MKLIDVLRMLPKTDLHVHLDGSVKLETLIDLAKANKVTLPSYTTEGLKKLVYKDRYNNLPEYLEGFKYTIAVMQTSEAIDEVSYQFAKDNILDGVRYVEVRFAPQFHVNKNLSFENVLLSVNKGLKRAADEFNSKDEIKHGTEPKFDYGIIVCAMRFFARGMSEYYDNFLDSHGYSDPKRICSLASMELSEAAVKIRNKFGIPIVGFDLAGPEAGYPAIDHKEAYFYAHKNFMKKTVHAGEAYGPESIFQAITELYADRIGHGYFLLDDTMITSEYIADKKKYVVDLSQYIADRRITIEVCLTSNLQTNPKLKDIKEHQFKNMFDTRLSVTFCTDNRTVSQTTMTDELFKAISSFSMRPKDLKNIIIYGFKRSFYSGTYLEKRKYVRQIIDYYEKIANQYLEDKPIPLSEECLKKN